MQNWTRRKTPTSAMCNCKCELAERSTTAHRRSVFTAAVGAIEDGRGQEDQYTIELENTTMSAVGRCNSKLVESSTMANHRSVCATAIGAILEGSGGCEGQRSIGLNNTRNIFLWWTMRRLQWQADHDGLRVECTSQTATAIQHSGFCSIQRDCTIQRVNPRTASDLWR